MANHAAKVIDLQDLQEKFHINVKIVGNMQTTNPAIFPFRDPSLCDNIKGTRAALPTSSQRARHVTS